MRRGIALAAVIGLQCLPAAAADLVWEVENPFRFHQDGRVFERHMRAFGAPRGAGDVLRVERALNDPDCSDRSSFAACRATAGRRYEEARLGWAAQLVGGLCYDGDVRPRRLKSPCRRSYSWGDRDEDYVRPEAHTVRVRLSVPLRNEAGDGSCTWTWRPLVGPPEAPQAKPCAQDFVVRAVPFDARRAERSGGTVEAKLPDGRTVSERVRVDDVLVVGLGDSFGSGEGNPDRPVRLSAARSMLYGKDLPTETAEVFQRNMRAFPDPSEAEQKLARGSFGALPRVLLADERGQELSGGNLDVNARSRNAFFANVARWTSPDCHRSQYSYQARVALQLALEDRHRAVTFIHLACTGAEVTDGMFFEKDARSDLSKRGSAEVPGQFDQLADYLCEEGSRTLVKPYLLPTFTYGSAKITPRPTEIRWCGPGRLKRPIDLVLLSIGGNDVGFSALAGYSVMDRAGDIAPIVEAVGSQVRFGPEVARPYLEVLDERLQAVKLTLGEQFGVPPGKVVQTSYESLQFDEAGQVCGKVPTLGMSVHGQLRTDPERLGQVSVFVGEFLKRLECTANKAGGCPADLATGAGTGFRLVTSHQPAFVRRGFCARDPARLDVETAEMGMPRRWSGRPFEPFSPADFLPYAHRQRLFRTPNDSFLTANTHKESILLHDRLQPAHAALYGGAFHRTAEGHAIVADHVMPSARQVLAAD